MKFYYWLELPTAIISLLSEKSTLEESSTAAKLLNSSKVISQMTSKLYQSIDLLSLSVGFENSNSIKTLKKRIQDLEKEKSCIVIQAMKFSVQLSSKLGSIIEEEIKTSRSMIDNILLTKIKYFLTLLKNTINQLTIHIQSKNNNFIIGELESELNFCHTLKVFFEKLESKFFNFSMNYINKKSSIGVMNDDNQNGKEKNSPSPYSTPQIRTLKIN